MAEEQSIADDMLRNGYDRWHRLEEEKAAIGEDLKELFAELKGHGFTPKALRESFRRVRNINDADQKEHDAIVDLYVASLTGARPAHTRGASKSTTKNASNSGHDAAKSSDFGTTPEHDADGVIIEPQSAPQAASDLTSPQAINGQVAAIQPETATDYSSVGIFSGIGSARDTSAMLHPEVVDGPTTIALQVGTVVTAGETATQFLGDGNTVGRTDNAVAKAVNGTENVDRDDATGGESAATSLVSHSAADGVPRPEGECGAEPRPAPIYAEPGIVTMEHTGPEPYAQHPYAECWPIYPVDVTGGVREPIVKIGALILDGRGRFLAARSVRVADNLTMEYPTVQYDGTDALLDCIRWNLSSRSMSPQARGIVCGKLVKLAPEREVEIEEMFEACAAQDRRAAE